MEHESTLGALARQVTGDVSRLARDHMELARLELAADVRAAAVDVAIAAMAALTAVVGFALLCVTAVVGLEGTIPALWVRMLVMSLLYLILGGAVTAWFAARLRREVTNLHRTRRAVRGTFWALRRASREVQHA